MQPHELIDRLDTDVKHLSRLDPESDDEREVTLALTAAKRVRRNATLLLRLIASHRDQLQR